MSFHFPDQREGEQVIMVIRKHFVVYFRLLAAFFLLFILPVLLALIGMSLYTSYAENPRFFLIAGLVMLMYILYGLLFLMVSWIGEEFDLFVLTDQRLVDITQESFFKRSVATAPLNQIQDATHKENGFLQTVLNYGDVDVRTAGGDRSSFFIDRVYNPAHVARAILDTAHSPTPSAFAENSPVS